VQPSSHRRLILLVDLFLYLFEPGVVILRVERVSHLSLCDVHGCVPAGVSLYVYVFGLQVVAAHLPDNRRLTQPPVLLLLCHVLHVCLVCNYVAIVSRFDQVDPLGLLVRGRRELGRTLNKVVHKILCLLLIHRKSLRRRWLLIVLHRLIDVVLVLLQELLPHAEVLPVALEDVRLIVGRLPQHGPVGRESLALATHVRVVQQVVGLRFELQVIKISYRLPFRSGGRYPRCLWR
jgi:hypothetical protein